MLKMNLNFDDNIHGSEEYCLFMQMAAISDFISIEEFVVKYRIHNSLTFNLGDRKFKERNYTLNRILNRNPELKVKYKNEFKEAFARSNYYKAQFLMEKGKNVQAFKVLFPNILLNIKSATY